jgi:hypothetical protein
VTTYFLDVLERLSVSSTLGDTRNAAWPRKASFCVLTFASQFLFLIIFSVRSNFPRRVLLGADYEGFVAFAIEKKKTALVLCRQHVRLTSLLVQPVASFVAQYQ